MSTTMVPALEEVRAVAMRRELFCKVFTPEVLDAVDKFLGTNTMIYAFPTDNLDPLLAMRRDTLMGVMRSLRHESDEGNLVLARATLAQLEREVQHA